MKIAIRGKVCNENRGVGVVFEGFKKLIREAQVGSEVIAIGFTSLTAFCLYSFVSFFVLGLCSLDTSFSCL